MSNTANVVWLGHLDPDTHRALSARVEIYLSAARREEYGGVQREALVDGAVLVRAPSAGPEQLLAIARSLDPELVAGDFDARTLAACLTRALSMSEQDRLSYRARAMELMSPNTRANLERILADDVLGVLEVELPGRGEGEARRCRSSIRRGTSTRHRGAPPESNRPRDDRRRGPSQPLTDPVHLADSDARAGASAQRRGHARLL